MQSYVNIYLYVSAFTNFRYFGESDTPKNNSESTSTFRRKLPHICEKIGHKTTPVLFFKWSCRAALADVGKQLGELAVPVAVLLANVLGLLALYKWFEQSKRGRLEGTNPEWTRTVPRAIYLNNIEYYRIILNEGSSLN